jgi:hypothetical protein
MGIPTGKVSLTLAATLQTIVEAWLIYCRRL